MEKEMKEFYVTYEYKMIGTVAISVPSHFTMEQAIEYAKENIDEIPLPDDPYYIDCSSIVDEESCMLDDGNSDFE